MATELRHIDYVRPWVAGYQRQMLDCPARYTLTEASTKAGKTASHIIWLFEQALQGQTEYNYWWVAPTSGQARIAYKRMKRQVGAGFFESHDTELRLTLPMGSIIWFKTAEIPDNLYGDDVHAAVFDEFTRAREESWFALRSTLTATKGPCKFIGNVKGKNNWGYKLAQKAKHDTTGVYAYFKITAWDAVAAGILDRAEVEQARVDLPRAVFEELYEATPSEDGSNPFGLSFIRKCVNLGHELAPGPAVAYGIDLAKSFDYAVAVGLNATGYVCHLDRWQLPWAETKKKILALPDVPTLIDSTGVGDPIVEEVMQTRKRTEGFKFSSSSKQQLMEGLAVAFQQVGIGIPDGWLRDECESFEYEVTRTGVRYAAPEGQHDDGVCALALARRCFVTPPKQKHAEPANYF